MIVNLNIENAKLDINIGDLIIVQNKINHNQKMFLVVKGYNSSLPYTLLNIQENKIMDSYENLTNLLKDIKYNYKILEIIPSDKLELRRIVR